LSLENDSYKITITSDAIQSQGRTFQSLENALNIQSNLDNKTTSVPVRNSLKDEFNAQIANSYQVLFTTMTDLQPIQSSFTTLANYIKKKYQVNSLDEFLTNENKKVSSEFAQVSTILGENISAANIGTNLRPTGSLSGTIADQYGVKLSGVSVVITLNNVSYTTTTSSSGTYSIQKVIPNTYSFSAKKTNYPNGTGSVTINPNKNTVHNQTLSGTASNVLNFVVTSGVEQNTLTWNNPVSEFSGVIIRFSTTGYPTSVTDGTLLTNTTGQSYTHTSLTNIAYYYTAFSYNNGISTYYSSGVTGTATPTIALLDFVTEPLTIVIPNQSSLTSGVWHKVSGGGFTERTIVQTGAFTNYTSTTSTDQILLTAYSGPAGVELGFWSIAQKLDNNTIQLEVDIGTNGAANIVGMLQIEYAANELKNHITSSLGVTPTISTSASVSGINIHLGRSTYVDTQIPEVSSLDAEGYIIVGVDARNYIIAGSTDMGTEFGVYEFLERYFGVVWAFPDSTSLPTSVSSVIGTATLSGAEIPTYSSLTVAATKITHEPYYLTRYPTGLGSNSTLGAADIYANVHTRWARRNRFSDRNEGRHYLASLMAPGDPPANIIFGLQLTYNFANNASPNYHPEYYRDGTLAGIPYTPSASGNNWVPNYTEPGTVTAVLGNVKKVFDLFSLQEGVSVSAGDTDYYDSSATSLLQRQSVESASFSGTTVTIAGGDYRTKYKNGDYWVIYNSAQGWYWLRKLSNVQYSGGNTTFTVDYTMGSKTTGYIGNLNIKTNENHSWETFKWTNDLLTQLNATPGYENKRIGNLGYRGTLDPPDIPNVGGDLAFSVSNPLSSKLVAFFAFERIRWLDTTFRNKDLYQSHFQRWKSTGVTMGTYDYVYGEVYCVPRLYTNTMQEYLEYDYNNGCRHWIGEFAGMSILEGPKNWVLMKLLWNPAQNADDLVLQWCVACVGSVAGTYLKLFYDTWTNFWESDVVQNSSYLTFMNDYGSSSTGSYENGSFLDFNNMSYLGITAAHNAFITAETYMTNVLSSATGTHLKRAQLLNNHFSFYKAHDRAYYPRTYARNVATGTNVTPSTPLVELAVDAFVDGLTGQQDRYDWVTANPARNYHAAGNFTGINDSNAETIGNSWHNELLYRLIPHASTTLSVDYSSKTVDEVITDIYENATTDYPDFYSTVKDNITNYYYAVDNSYTNLIDGSFEQASLSGGSTPWASSAASYTLDTTKKRSGSKSLKITGTLTHGVITNNGDIRCNNTQNQVNGGAGQAGNYIFTGYMYCNTAPVGTLNFNIISRKDVGDVDPGHAAAATPLSGVFYPVAGEWVPFYFFFNIPEDYMVTLDITMFNGLETGDTVWLDDLAVNYIEYNSVSSVSEPTPGNVTWTFDNTVDPGVVLADCLGLQVKRNSDWVTPDSLVSVGSSSVTLHYTYTS